MPPFSALFILHVLFSLLLQTRGSELKLKYKWDPNDPEFNGIVVVRWDQEGKCTPRPFKKDKPKCNTAIAILTVFGNGRDGLPTEKLATSVFSKNPTGFKCVARQYMKLFITKENDPNTWFEIEVDHICCDSECKFEDMPNVKCARGPKGQVLKWGDNFIYDCDQ